MKEISAWFLRCEPVADIAPPTRLPVVAELVVKPVLRRPVQTTTDSTCRKYSTCFQILLAKAGHARCAPVKAAGLHSDGLSVMPRAPRGPAVTTRPLRKSTRQENPDYRAESW